MTLTSRAVSLLLVGLLTACSGGGSQEEPAAAPTSAAASAAASGGPAPLSAAEQEAVQAAVVDYFEGYDRAFETGDAAQLAAGSDPSCPCRRIVEDLERALADGSIEGNRYSVGTVIVGQAQDGITAATAVVTSTAGRQLDAGGTVVRALDAQVDVTKRLLLTNRSGSWKVLQVG